MLQARISEITAENAALQRHLTLMQTEMDSLQAGISKMLPYEGSSCMVPAEPQPQRRLSQLSSPAQQLTVLGLLGDRVSLRASPSDTASAAPLTPMSDDAADMDNFIASLEADEHLRVGDLMEDEAPGDYNPFAKV
ncbi:MAG: hypothetical protein P1U40_14100 [Coxiellaceae bacterium]|nr:hypothetical protein [Coxiellaceae bacterium]